MVGGVLSNAAICASVPWCTLGLCPSTHQTVVTIEEMGWELLPHLQYSPDLGPSDFHLDHSKYFVETSSLRMMKKMVNNMSGSFYMMPTKTSTLQASAN